MSTCSSCGWPAMENGRFCSSCGAALTSDDLATLDYGVSSRQAAARKPASGPGSRPSSSSTVFLNEGRFLPGRYSTDYLMGVRASIGEWLLHIPQSIQTTLVFFFVLLFFRVLLRKEWLAAIAFVALLTLPRMAGSDFLRVEAPAQILIYGMAVIVVLRFGLVALAAGAFAVDALLNVPLAADFSNWYAANATLALLSIVALAVWSFYCALGGRSPWGQSAEASGLGE